MPAPQATWPLLLDDRTAAAMLSVTRPALRRLVRIGEVPASRSVGGLERWHRDEIEAHLRRVWGLDVAEQITEQHKRVAQDALDAWDAPTKRGGKRRESGGRAN
jgi:excisionase family DNA binding protein